MKSIGKAIITSALIGAPCFCLVNKYEKAGEFFMWLLGMVLVLYEAKTYFGSDK